MTLWNIQRFKIMPVCGSVRGGWSLFMSVCVYIYVNSSILGGYAAVGFTVCAMTVCVVSLS